MSDMAYIMETQDPQELWLVEGDQKFKVSRDMYWLLVSKGADLPPTHQITELLTENAKLRELVKSIYLNYAADGVAPLGMIWEYASRMKELGIEVGE